MDQAKQPSKETVRQWLKNEIAKRRPPPDQEQIRRELGWDLIESRRNAKSGI